MDRARETKREEDNKDRRSGDPVLVACENLPPATGSETGNGIRGPAGILNSNC